MTKTKNRKIDFVQKGVNNENRRKIDFVPNEAAQRLRRSNHSDINELKAYLNPRGNKY